MVLERELDSQWHRSNIALRYNIFKTANPSQEYRLILIISLGVLLCTFENGLTKYIEFYLTCIF